jgi:hypothetical protein
MRLPSLLARIGAVLFLATCAATPMPATTLARLSLDQLARAADTVARVRCADSTSYVQDGTVWTRTQFTVIESFKGAPPAQIAVRLPGGRAGHIFVAVEAAPRFRPGEEGVLFLEPIAGGDYSVTAWALGTFRIRRNARTGEESVTQDSSALAVFDLATRRFVIEGIRDLSWPEFRRRLTATFRSSTTTGVAGGGRR